MFTRGSGGMEGEDALVVNISPMETFLLPGRGNYLVSEVGESSQGNE
jgi:hypothetical protein